jgi:hypothetical protein
MIWCLYKFYDVVKNKTTNILFVKYIFLHVPFLYVPNNNYNKEILNNNNVASCTKII